MMNKRIKELAEEAGFVMWADEEWNPGDVIDWSNSYDKELQQLIKLVVQECGQIADSSRQGATFPSVLMKKYFGIE